MRGKLLILLPLLVAATGATAAGAFAGDRGDLAQAKRATKQFRNIETAKHAEYGELLDLQGIACISMPGMGTMGIHYVKGALVGDGAINATTPEALVYEPQEHGKLKLVALEYVVLKDAWDAAHPDPPSLFGQPFNFTPSPNRYGLPPFYSLHAWIFKHNPAGTFAMWNPNVHCNPSDEGHGDDGHSGDMSGMNMHDE